MKAIKIVFTCFTAILFLYSAGCAHKHFSSGIAKTKYQCENGFEFVSEIHKDQGADQVIVKTGNQLYVLDITPSASGSKYTDGSNIFWSKGDSAMLELADGKAYEECKIIK